MPVRTLIPLFNYLIFPHNLFIERDNRCKCRNGTYSDGDKKTNSAGVCEHFCSKAGRRGQCGSGLIYKEDESVDCRGNYEYL